MGTTVQSIAGRSQTDSGHAPGAGQQFFNQRGSNWQQQPQHSIESPEATFSTPAPNASSLFNQAQNPGAPFDGPGAGLPPNRGPSQIPNNNSVGNGPVPRNVHTPTPAAAQGGVNGSAAQQAANLERRGPVEFNHAISYVNKIKVSTIGGLLDYPKASLSCSKLCPLTPNFGLSFCCGQ
jgi:paired amphipathic helix protein Sin3a